MICSKCKTEKSETNFHKDPRYKTGFGSWCKECKKTYYKIYYQVRSKKIKAQSKIYHCANREKDKITNKAYYQNHPEKAMLKCRKRKALKLGVRHEDYVSNYIFLRDNWICGICGRKINKRLKWPNPLSSSLDHIIPLSKGGDDNPINVQAAHLRCNIGKHTKKGGQLRLLG